MSKIWLTTDGSPRTSILAAFSRKDGAERYLKQLVDRYALGRSLSLFGKPIAENAGAWELGLGPAVVEQDVDEGFDSLAGAWVVKVDESCRMVSCEFSTKLSATHPPATYRTGIHHICQAHGATPHAALDVARRGMLAYLGR